MEREGIESNLGKREEKNFINEPDLLDFKKLLLISKCPSGES